MIRKIACALALVTASYAGFVQALGLGEAKVNSSLNQPLRAEIQLLSADGLSEEEILPGLATREEFLKAGIDRVYFLSDINFDVATGSNGEPVVVLSTKKPVREPFLNFLVEVIWPSGRLLREYALLIDPPLFSEDKVVAASEAAVPAPAQVIAPVQRAAPTIERGDNLNVPATVQPRSGSLAGAQSYGPTKNTDTLWDIALDVRPDRSVSPQQVMLAIQDLNPNAFIDNNINKLKEGQILRLPSKDQIRSRSASAAINEVIAQNAALRKPRTQTPKNVSNTQTSAPSTVAKTGGDELKLVVADKESKASDSGSSDPSGTSSAGVASSEELALTLEKLDKATLENEELGDKVEALEDQLETLQRLLTLKNDQLAGMQAQMRANDLAEAEAQEGLIDGVEGTSPANDEAMTSESDLGGENAAQDELATASELGVEGEAEVAQEESGLAPEQQIAAESMPAEPEEQQVEQAPESTAQQPVSAPKTIQDEILEALVSNPLYQAAAAGVLIILLALLWVLSRKRADKEMQDTSADDDYEYEESPEYAEDGGFEEESDSYDEEDEEAEPESEPSSDESEDVIAEADVYIAYGRLDQAATILEQGISADPVRVDYRLKLLEVYRDGLEEASFNKQMSELEAIQDEDALSKAAALKEELMARLKEQDSVEEAEPTESVEQLLDEDEAEALMQPDDNNFDFDSVDESNGDEIPAPVTESDAAIDELAEEVADEIDLDSDELDVDLDIDLDLDSVDGALSSDELDSDKSSVNHDGTIDYDTTDLGIEEESEQVEEDLKDGLTDELAEELDGSLDLATSLPEDAEVLDDVELDGDLNLEAEIDLDLDMAEDLGVELGEQSAEELDDEMPNFEEDLALDLDDELGMETASDEVDVPSEVEDIEEIEALDDVLEESEELSVDDLDLEGLDDVEEVEVDSSPEIDGVDAAALEVDDIDADTLDLGDDDELVVTDETLDEAASALGEADEFEPELSEDEDFDFLEGTDEASTKLDLARAYIDMGDTDGAREILQEVEKDGNPDQQAQAKELINSLGG